MSLKSWMISLSASFTILIVMSIVLLLNVLENEKNRYHGETRFNQVRQLAHELRLSTDHLTHSIRSFITTNNPVYQSHFKKIRRIRQGTLPRPHKYQEVDWSGIFAGDPFPKFKGKSTPLIELIEKSPLAKGEKVLIRRAYQQGEKLADWEEGVMGQKLRPMAKLDLMYSKKYRDIRHKLAFYLDQFFYTTKQHHQDKVQGHLEKKGRLVFVLVLTMSLSVVLIFISTLLAFIYLQRRKEETLGDETVFTYIKNNFWQNWPLLTTTMVTILIIMILGQWFFRETKSLSRSEVKKRLEFNLNVTYSAISDWIEQTQRKVAFTTTMINRYIAKKSFHQELNRTGVLQLGLFKNYLVVNNKGIVTSGNLKDYPLGHHLKFPFKTFYQKSKVFFPHREENSHPLLTKYIVWASLLKNNSGTIFFFMNPAVELGSILQKNYADTSEEVYMVNSKGQFINQLVPNGTRDLSSTSPSIWPIEQILQGKNSMSLNKYNNYTGKTVLGLWRWDNTNRFGLISEIEREEADSLSTTYGHFTLIGSGFTICLTLVLTFLFIRGRMKITLVSKELNKTYTTIKKQNEKFAEELSIGQRVQMDMLPSIIKGKGFLLGAYLTPAQTVSGDFFDFSFVGGERKKIYFCVGDVSGKGVAAALFMSMSKVSLHKTLDKTLRPKELVTQVNQELSTNNESCMFVTLVVGVLDLTTGILRLTNAGHNPPYIKKQTGELISLNSVDGPLIGSFEGVEFKEQEILMEEGDTILLYTDGVTEAQNAEEEFFEEVRLERLLKRSYFSSPQNMVDSISKSVTQFIGKADQFDDITILSLEYHGGV